MRSSGMSEWRRSSSVTYGFDGENVSKTKIGVEGGFFLPIEEWTHLSVGYFSEALEDLLGGILVFGDADHKVNELLKGDVVAASARLHELLVHFLLVVYEAQTGEGGAKFELLQ